MMRIIFVFLAVTCGMIEMKSSILANVLPNLLRCSRYQNKLEKCIKRSITSIKPYLANGIPQLNIPTFEPYRMVLYELNIMGEEYNGTVQFTNIIIHGLTNYRIKHVHVSVDENQFQFVAFFPNIKVYTYYNINSTNFTLPIRADGYKMTGNFTNVKAKIVLDGVYYLYDETEEEYFRPEEVSMQLSVKDADTYMDNLDSLIPTLSETLNNIWQKVDHEILHIIPMTASDVILSVATVTLIIL